MHTRYFENEFGHMMTLTTKKTHIHSFRQEGQNGTQVTLKCGDKTIFSVVLTNEESKVLVRALSNN